MQTAKITTAARRIARDLTSRPPHTWVGFDADGHPVDAVYGQNMDRSHLGDCAHLLPSRPDSHGGRWTQRTVQDALDAPTLDWDA